MATLETSNQFELQFSMLFCKVSQTDSDKAGDPGRPQQVVSRKVQPPRLLPYTLLH